jgi:hypothetical protein
MNSITFIGRAIEFEARRQIEIIEDGGTIDQETRLYDSNKNETRSMRSKEEAHDYRYFPDPDLLPLEFSQAYVDELRAGLPELPDQKKKRFMTELGMNEYSAKVLVADKAAADFFERTLTRFSPYPMGKPRTAGEVLKWVTGELFGRLNKARLAIEQSPITSDQMADLLSFQFDGTLMASMTKQVLDRMWNTGRTPAEIIDELGLRQTSSSSAIENVIGDVVAANTAKVEDAKTNPNTIGWFVGQVMKSSEGKADPQKTSDLLRTKIFESWTRTRQEPLQRGERLFDLYDESGRDGYEALRSTLNLWVSEVEQPDHRNELISRMRKGGNAAFRAALTELIVHDLLVRLGHKISVHPVIPGATKRPDFALIDNKGRAISYVEVTTVNRPEKLEKEINRENEVYKAIDGVNLPDGCLLGYELIRAGSDSPSLEQLLNSIQKWAITNADRARTAEVVEQFTAGDWVIELELFSGADAAETTGAIGLASLPGGLISPHKDIRAALYRKSRGYGDMNAPYIIAVADAKDQMFGKTQVRDAITEAVFGDERVVLVEGKGEFDFTPNGFWRGPDGPRNKHVTAILFLPQIDIWKLRNPKWEPVLAINPWSTSQIPNSFKSLTRLEADQGKWIERKGKPIGDILGLPVPWPPEE